MRICTLLFLCLATACFVHATPPTTSPPSTLVALERKVVLVVAQNAIEAKQKAQQHNPGWTAVMASPADPFNPNNRLWEVSLQR